MFGKLLKYDFRSMFKQFAFIWPAALVLAAVNRYTVSGLKSTSATGETVAGVAMLVFVAIMIAMFVIAVIFVVQRFYKGLLGDEGYLMHTLPVCPWQLILSKLVCAVVLTVVSISVAIVSIKVIVSPVVELDRIFETLRFVWKAWSEPAGSTNGVNRVLTVAELFLLFLVEIAQSYLMLYLAMAIGHLFNRNRAAMSVAAYIGIQTIASTILKIVLFSAQLDDLASYMTMYQEVFHQPHWKYIHMLLWGAIAAAAAVAALYFYLTEYILRKKLNLE